MVPPQQLNPLAQRSRAISVAVSIFVLVTISATLIAFILPETFASAARVRPAPTRQTTVDERDQAAQVELIKSEPVLSEAASQLDLAAIWGRKYAGGNPLQSAEVLKLLRRDLDVRPIPDTSGVEIKVYSTSPTESAGIANQIALAYCARVGTNVAVVADRASVPERPVRPNKTLIIALSAVAGALLGGLVGAALMFLTRASGIA